MKRFLILVFIFTVNVLSAQSIRLFPYKLSLTGNSKPTQIIEGQSVNAPTGTARYTKDGIVLTNETKYGRSGFALNDIKFSSHLGLSIEFEYAIYGGTAIPGDGMSLFLFNADVPFSLGAGGPALGYSYMINPKSADYKPGVPTTEGVKGAFLGIGLDVYGAFKHRLSTPTNVAEGMPIASNEFHNNGKEYITIRGGANEFNKLGYPVIYTMSTTSSTTTTTSGYVTASIRTDGIYSKTPFRSGQYSDFNAFSLRTTKEANGNIKYRKLKVVFTPTNWGSILISLYNVVDGKDEIIQQQIDHAYAFDTYDENGKLYKFKCDLPKNLKIGFAASTGEYTQFQVVKNLVVDLPYTPLIKEDFVDLRVSPFSDNKGKTVTVSPFSNDQFYRGALYWGPKLGNDSTYIDSNSFRFEDNTGKQVGTVTAGKAVYNQPGVGTWEYNPSTRNVTLTLSESSYGNDLSTRVVNVYYSIKGTNYDEGPFNDEHYRCIPTKISVNLVKETSFDIMINPNFSINKN